MKRDEPLDREPLLTPEDLAERYRIKRKAVYALPIRKTKIGTLVRYKWSHVLAYESRPVKGRRRRKAEVAA